MFSRNWQRSRTFLYTQLGWKKQPSRNDGFSKWFNKNSKGACFLGHPVNLERFSTHRYRWALGKTGSWWLLRQPFWQSFPSSKCAAGHATRPTRRRKSRDLHRKQYDGADVRPRLPPQSDSWRFDVLFRDVWRTGYFRFEPVQSARLS